MGLIAAKCTNCGAKIEVDESKEAGICPHCGTAFITEKVVKNFINNNVYNINNAVFLSTQKADNTVIVQFPVYGGQLFNNKCFVYNCEKGVKICECRQGESVSFKIEKPTEIQVKMSGCFGKPKEIMKPGDRYKVGFRGFGKIYLCKVDNLN